MQDSINEQVKFCMTDDLREAYDHDLAWKEECRRQGLEEGRMAGREQGLQEGREQGREEGLQEGRKEGRYEERKEIIDRLINSGISDKEIKNIIKIIENE